MVSEDTSSANVFNPTFLNRIVSLRVRTWNLDRGLKWALPNYLDEPSNRLLL